MLNYSIRAGVDASGPPSRLLLHGFLGSGRNLGSLARRWCEAAPGEKLVMVDLRGHGMSPRLPADGGNLSLLAADVCELADHLKMSAPINLVGHSLGGRVGLKARFLQPERVGEVILLDISPSPTRGRSDALDEVLEAFVQAPAAAPSRDALREYFLGRGISTSLTEWLLLNLQKGSDGALQWRVDRPALQALHGRAGREDLWAAVELPGSRTWCIRGERSAFVDDADARRMAEASVRVDTVADAGHFVHADNLSALVHLLVGGASADNAAKHS